METYSLWNGGVDDDAVRLYATAINVQEIGSGTAAFVETLLSDCGLHISASGWTVSAPFATSYLSRDGDPAEWRDRWWVTWDIRVELATAQKVELPDRVVDTFAFDESWTGEENLPEAFVVVAAFADPRETEDMKRVMSRVLGRGGGYAATGLAPSMSALVARVEETLGSTTGPRARVLLGRSPRFIEVRIEPGQRAIDDTATTADLVEQLARSLGARTRYMPD